MLTLVIKTTDNAYLTKRSITLTDLLSAYKLTNTELTFIQNSLDTIGFAGVFQQREEGQFDNVNYLYISFFVDETVSAKFAGVKDCFITK